MITRLAPSPTGALHLGHARSFLAAWLHARKSGGKIYLRMEDLDAPRCQPWAIGQMLDDLRWLGLDWDTPPADWPGTVLDGPEGYVLQSKRTHLYDEALASLTQAARLFPCTKSRKDLQGLSSAPHGLDGLPPYPKAFRPASLSAGWFSEEKGKCALRFQVEDGLLCFEDRLAGRVCQDVAAEVGDFVLKRQDGFYAYQLAVVVDDLAMGVTDVVRGADLLLSTPRQMQLIEALGGQIPQYCHIGLVVGPDGQKLSKRDGGLELRALREQGVSKQRLLGWLGHSLGLMEESHGEASLPGLIAVFYWHPKAGDPIVLAPGTWV